MGEHHLLHGKIASLPKPYAVIRRVIGSPGQILSGKAVEGDADEEESQLGDEDEYDEEVCPQGTKGFRDNHEEEVDEEDERPLFPSNVIPTTPISRHQPCSSSPIYLPSARRDYSSELDRSSPVRGCDTDVFGSKRSRDDDDDDEGEGRLVKKKRLGRRLNGERKDEERERTRHYEVVGVVRKKVVFALR